MGNKPTHTTTAKMMKSAMMKRNMATTMKANQGAAPKVSFVRKVAQTAGVAASTLAITFAAQAADVKLGSDSRALVFDPATVTINKGDSVTWKNNAGFPHNSMFDVSGTYSYYCEPHQGAGMQGKVIVK